MTLNFPPSSPFITNPGPVSGELFSSIWVWNSVLPEERACGDVCGRSWKHFWDETIEPRREMNNLVDYLHDDILDILPSDPFGIESYNSGCSSSSSASSELDHDDVFSDSDLDVDLETAALTVAGWLEDFEGKPDGDLDGIVKVGSIIFGDNGVDVIDEDYQLFADLNLLWSNAVLFQNSFADYTAGSKNSSSFELDDLVFDEKLCDGRHGLKGLKLVEGNEGFCYEQYRTVNIDGDCRIADSGECSVSSYSGDDGAPHDAIFFALGYLGLKDLLSVGGVCRSLHHAVQSDPLLWRRIHVGHPLNRRLTDDILISLTSKAQGGLQCLNLVDCYEITCAGLKHILESNPNLTKLSISGCARLTIEGIIDNMKSFRSISGRGLKQLRLGDLYGVTRKHYEELLALLDADTRGTREARKPQYYHLGSFPISHDDERLIDVEACPRCENVRLVYDCPAEGCRSKPRTDSSACRACTFCISRCVQCGVCVKDGEYEETFSLDLLCFRCWWVLFDGPAAEEGGDHQFAVEPFYARRAQLNCSCSIYIC